MQDSEFGHSQDWRLSRCRWMQRALIVLLLEQLVCLWPPSVHAPCATESMHACTAIPFFTSCLFIAPLCSLILNTHSPTCSSCRCFSTLQPRNTFSYLFCTDLYCMFCSLVHFTRPHRDHHTVCATYTASMKPLYQLVAVVVIDWAAAILASMRTNLERWLATSLDSPSLVTPSAVAC